jgi:hypothetical protein
MNERIRELAEQVGFGWDDKYHWYVGSRQMEKFAELIVQECVTIVVDAVDHREPASTYASKIQQHFGVK